MSVRRVRVHAERDGEPVTVDVVLPSHPPMGELLPALVDLVDDLPGPRQEATDWRLDRLSGADLSESLSLSDNAVDDGETFVLTRLDAPTLGPLTVEPCRAVAESEPPAQGGVDLLPGTTCIAASAVAAVALGWAGTRFDSAPVTVVAAVGACLAVAASIARRDSIAPAVASVTLTGATGYLAVPAGPSAANAFLAAVAAFSAALLMMRLTRRAPTLVALATLALPVALATVVSVPAPLTGAILATAALVLLAAAPRIAVLTSGLAPGHWAGGLDDRAATGHATLTGVVAGCAAGVAAGTVLLAIAQVVAGVITVGAVAFAGLVAAVLLLRARTYVDDHRRVTLATGGMVCGLACFGLAVVGDAAHAGWYCGVLVGAGLAAAIRPPIGGTLVRVADRLEYVAVAAVVPTACWVGGLYDLARGLHPW